MNINVPNISVVLYCYVTFEVKQVYLTLNTLEMMSNRKAPGRKAFGNLYVYFLILENCFFFDFYGFETHLRDIFSSFCLLVFK